MAAAAAAAAATHTNSVANTNAVAGIGTHSGELGGGRQAACAVLALHLAQLVNVVHLALHDDVEADEAAVGGEAQHELGHRNRVEGEPQPHARQPRAARVAHAHRLLRPIVRARLRPRARGPLGLTHLLLRIPQLVPQQLLRLATEQPHSVHARPAREETHQAQSRGRPQDH
eukprot:scaffold110542_cov75-Phaeocystis_antarctica.AAC.2